MSSYLGDYGGPVDQVAVRGIRGRGTHGVLAQEKRDGQEFSVDVVMHVPTVRAGGSDDLRDAVDYSVVAGTAHSILVGESLYLVEAVAERLAFYKASNVVLDTVMLAKSGDPLLAPSAVESLRRRLLPHVALITPNLPEAAALLDAPHARNEIEMREQGEALLAMGCEAVLMKGGHLDDAESPDWLFTRGDVLRFTAPRVQTKNTHGTGCTLSAALAALRPRHADWAATVIEAKAWLSAALAQADSLEVGHGIGPVHHFHAWW